MTQLHLNKGWGQAREDICRVGKSLYERGYMHATAGNISMRIDDGFLDPNELAHVDAHGVQLSGAKASKTLALHRRIYSASQTLSPQTCCIIHSHSTHLVALSLKHAVFQTPMGTELLAPITPYFVMKVGHVPLIDYHRPGDVTAADKVAQTITHYAQHGLPLHAVMLSRLGPNVWHDSPAQAMATLEELEETARLTLLTNPGALSESDIEELRKSFGAHW